ncbi:MAG: hypothetical protein ACLQOO_10090 [Terriglobia bacterium]
MSESHEHDGTHVEWVELGRIGFVGLAIMATWFRLWQPLPHFDVVGFAAVLIGGYPIFHEAFADLLSRRMTMELSMTWIRRIPASPEAAKRRVDRRWVRIVEFRQFLTFG